MISKEIEELTKERHAIEAEVAQKEADIRIKTGEMRSLQVLYFFSSLMNEKNKK
jgi:epidermal growth factor receptor substrate 15